MAVQIGAKPDSGFEDPLGMLKDCHRRIEHFLHILCAVVERARGRGLTVEESVATQAALDYFRTGGKRHTADEEESLFPRLVATGEFSEFARLEDDHRDADQLHGEVELLYRTWIAEDLFSEEERGRLLAATAKLRSLYEAHIRIEDEIVFPKAAELLDRETIAAIGQEFRTRRT